jgi:hypothetical protein
MLRSLFSRLFHRRNRVDCLLEAGVPYKLSVFVGGDTVNIAVNSDIEKELIDGLSQGRPFVRLKPLGTVNTVVFLPLRYPMSISPNVQQYVDTLSAAPDNRNEQEGGHVDQDGRAS